VDPDTVLNVNAPRHRLRRTALTAIMVLASVNIWTGSPLLALWVGSRVVETTRPTMGAVALIVLTLAGCSLALVWILGRAGAAYDELTGQGPSVRRHVSWLRSMRDERVEWERSRISSTRLEKILVVLVVLAVLAFEAWFFLASPSPIEPGPAKD
jgi:hypothetical protein